MTFTLHPSPASGIIKLLSSLPCSLWAHLPQAKQMEKGVQDA